MQRERPLVIGVGNPQCGDDAAGPLVIEQIGSRAGSRIDLEAITGACTGLVEHLCERDNVIIVDACKSGAPAGTLHCLDAGRTEPYQGSISCHGFGVAEAIALARVMGTMPKSCTIFAIEGKNFGMADVMSEPVRRAVTSLVSDLSRQLQLD
ncbi:hydrogenase maturation protease [Hoeflea sp. TYP-13]|uniref:hydrogenase maturation protease n=1 Tax=Hoeflea sp. TYP-13 TaxID=3230023 RepID=UPI0034C60424